MQIYNLNISITDYLAELFSKGVLTEEQATQTAKMMYVLTDVERISTLCRDISASIREKIDKKYNFTDEAMAELEKSLAMIEKMYSDTLEVIEGEDIGCKNREYEPYCTSQECYYKGIENIAKEIPSFQCSLVVIKVKKGGRKKLGIQKLRRSLEG